MLSWRLWQTIAEPVTKNPIFNRVRNDDSSHPKSDFRFKIPRYIYFVAIFLGVIALIRIPSGFVMLVQVPVLFIVLTVISPLLLPFAVFFGGGYLVSKVTSNIHREKRQYTYELLCASPLGSLNANWLFAAGLLHRGGWFHTLKLGMFFTYRVGQVVIVILGILTLLTFFSTDDLSRAESLRTLINLMLLLGLYYASLFQAIVLSLLIGLYTSSTDLSRRDANFVCLVTHILLQFLPYGIAFVLYISLNSMFLNPNILVSMVVDIIILSSIYLTREIFIVFLWEQLKQKLNSSSDNPFMPSQVVSITG